MDAKVKGLYPHFDRHSLYVVVIELIRSDLCTEKHPTASPCAVAGEGGGGAFVDIRLGSWSRRLVKAPPRRTPTSRPTEHSLHHVTLFQSRSLYF